MIFAYIGGIGSGKTVSCIREIIRCKGLPVTNFRIHKKDYYRLRYQDLIIKKEVEIGKTRSKTVSEVNWKFWEAFRKKYENFSIFVDEAHNIIGSRESMSKKNILLSRWVSQVRKILSDSKFNHFHYVSQTPRRVEVNFRDLTHWVVECKKIELRNDKIFVKQILYKGFQNYEMGISYGKTGFVANKYFPYYNTHDMIKFGDADEFI